MTCGRDEALDIFRLWLSDRALLVCNFSFSRFAAAFPVRLRSVTESELKFLADDGTSELVLPLTSDLFFGYGDASRVETEADGFDKAIVVFFSDPAAKVEPDFVSFAEVLEGG